MKKAALILTFILITSGFIACSLSPESAFFSKFSIQQLVEKNKAPTGLDCEGNGNDRGGGIGGGGGGVSFGFGRKEYHSHRGDGFFCKLKATALEHFDEASLIAALRQDVERAIDQSGAKVIESGNPDSASFYFAYSIDNALGRVEISGKRIRNDYYSVRAELDERSKGATK
jgi:hypothetical protein